MTHSPRRELPEPAHLNHARHDFLSLCFLLLFCIVLFPILSGKFWNAHDLFFHTLRILQWNQEGVLISGGDLLAGPLNLFYPPLSVWLGHLCALFCSLFYGNAEIAAWRGAICAFGIIIILSALSMYYFALRVWDSHKAAVIAMAIYVTSPYFLSCIYIRGAMGEACAYIFLPLLALGIASAFFGNRREHFWMGIGGAGILLSNLPIALITFLCLAVFSVCHLKKFMDIALLRLLGLNILAALLLGGASLIPMLEQVLHGDHFKPISDNILLYVHGLGLRDLFWPEPGMSSIYFFFSLPLLCWSLYIPIWRSKDSFPLCAACVGLTLLTLRCFYSPQLPHLMLAMESHIFHFQFPWRILTPTIFLGCALVACNASNYYRKPRKDIALYATLLTCCVVALIVVTKISLTGPIYPCPQPMTICPANLCATNLFPSTRA